MPDETGFFIWQKRGTSVPYVSSFNMPQSIEIMGKGAIFLKKKHMKWLFSSIVLLVLCIGQPSLLHFPEKMNQQSIQNLEENRTWSLLNMEFLLYSMRNEEVRGQWSNMILQSVKQISQSIENLIEKENLTCTLSPEEMAWTILSLENGIAIFHYISHDHIPIDLLEKSLKRIFSLNKN